MSLKHRRVVTVADDSADVAAGKLCPSHWGSTSTDYATGPTHAFDGGSLGALLYRDTTPLEGVSWLSPGAAGTVLIGTGAAPAFSDTPSLTSLTLSTPLAIASGGIGPAVAAGSVLVSGSPASWSATPSLTSATFGNYVVSSGPFVTASGHRWLHSEAGGGGGSVFENTCGGYDAGAALAGNCYANAIWGKNAGRLLNGTAPAACSNALFGYGSGEFLTTGSFNTLYGTATGGSLTTQSGLTHVGYHAGNRTSGTGNSFFGQFAGRGAASIATGTSNTAGGDSSMTAFTTATSCAAWGISTLENCTSGSQNTAMGSFSLRATTTNSGCIGLGYFAGAFETGSNKFFVNNVSRVNEAGDRTLSIIYGVMAALAKNQTLTFNVGATKIATPDTFANLPSAPAEGMLAVVTDASTATWGATIAGSGANRVLAYYNGTNWTVAGK